VWFQIFWHILVTDRNILIMLKTFWLHSKWRNIKRHWKCIVTAFCMLSKYSYSIPTAFHTFWSHSRDNFLYPWPHSLHQLIKHDRLQPHEVEGRLWGVLLWAWAPPSVWCNVHTASFFRLPAMDRSDIFWVFCFSFLSWPPPHLFQAYIAGGQQSGAKQHRLAGHSILYNGWLIKMLNSAALYTLSGNILDTRMRHSCCISSTFEVHSKCFGSHSGSILTAFVQHSRHLPWGVLFGQQSNCTNILVHDFRSAFWTLWQHSEYSYCVSITFELHLRDNTLGMCKIHLMQVRSEFVVFERNSWKMTFPPKCGSKFEIPAGSVSFPLSVTVLYSWCTNASKSVFWTGGSLWG